jgi:simple sugar transport system permease protein
MIEYLVPILAGTLPAATPLVLAGLGELITERAGVLNLGVEGMMLMGAIAGFACAATTGTGVAGALLAGAFGGAAGSAIFALLAVWLAANQAASGIALTIFGTGLSAFIGQHFVSYSLPGLQPVSLPGLSTLPLVGPVLFHQDPVVYFTLAVFVLVSWTLARTRVGLVLRAVGEAPDAAHALGYPVLWIRTLAVLAGGALTGMAGAYLSTVYTPMWVQNMTAGRGWIAVALVVFAAWKPGRLLLGAWLFGGVTILQLQAQGLGIALPSQLMSALPYLATIVALVLMSRKQRLLQVSVPAALGKPYLPGA